MIALDVLTYMFCVFVIHQKMLSFLLILMQLAEDAHLSKPEGE